MQDVAKLDENELDWAHPHLKMKNVISETFSSSFVQDLNDNVHNDLEAVGISNAIGVSDTCPFAKWHLACCLTHTNSSRNGIDWQSFSTIVKTETNISSLYFALL